MSQDDETRKSERATAPGPSPSATTASSSSEEVSLIGTIERIVFRNAENQWTVARFVPEGKEHPVTIVGSLIDVVEGTPLAVRGRWNDDPRFGRQLKLQSFNIQSPTTLAGIERYLGSGLIRGIGPELAKRIVGAFGHHSLDVIGKDPKRLEEVDGIGPMRARKLTAAWAETQHIQDVMVFLRGHGIGNALALRIYKRYGEQTIDTIRKNPYRLALDLWGVGFKTADAIALNLGIPREAPARIEAGVIHCLGKFGKSGHVHAPIQLLIDEAAALLESTADACRSAVDRLTQSNLVITEALGELGTCVSLFGLWEAETDAAAAVARLAAQPPPAVGAAVDEHIAEFERRSGFVLANAQRQAIRLSAESSCLVITGGPGVGKTTIVRGIVDLFRAGGKSISLAAPTGRAAQRLGESTAQEALTIHRLLEFQPQTGIFERNAQRPIDSDLVIIDEASMIDIELFRALCTAIPTKSRLVLVGDIDQLPSVGPGSVLADIIDSGVANVVRLEEIFRQAARSQIVIAAHDVNRGALPVLDAPAGDDPSRSDFYFIGREDPDKALSTVIELAAQRIESRFGFDPIWDLQILCPMHRGSLGTQVLNSRLQERLNPAAAERGELVFGDRAFRCGDKVMQVKNDYERGVFNGDIGVVASVADSDLIVELADGRAVAYGRGDLDELIHAYAVSVHKSQGSEYRGIILALSTQHYMMLQRNLLYTAITRGKELVIIVGSRRALQMAVANDSGKKRHTFLDQRILEMTRVLADS